MITAILACFRHLRNQGLWREERGAAFLVVLAFLGLAVPLAVSAVSMASTLNRSSAVYDARLSSLYNAGSGIEAVLAEILGDPEFDAELTPEEPDKELEVTYNDEVIYVTVTKQFTSAEIEGQAIVVSKEVTPATAPVDTLTTFTYTITLKNEGTDEVTVRRILDFLPPGLTYASGSTSGVTTSNPSVTTGPATCDSTPQALEWNVQPLNVVIGPSEQETLTFEATGTLPDGMYFNQGGARYTPWWDSNDVFVYSSHTAEITVGAGDPKCGYDMRVMITSEVDPAVPEPGVEQDFTYTIYVENVSPEPIYVCAIENLLPPDFVYNDGSASAEGGNIWPYEPEQEWKSGPKRWELLWDDDDYPLVTLASGETGEQTFKATATPESGVNYYNEFSVTWSDELTGGGRCKGGNSGGSIQGGAGEGSAVDSPITYDISAVAPDGTILSRVIYYESAGEVEILSWQEY